jgi:hypothetical protein
MIESADEFIQLRYSEDPKEYGRSANDAATESVWLDVIERFPEARKWVALNKKLPENILWKLVRDSDRDVRYMVACRNQLTAKMFEELAKDIDSSIRARICGNKRVPEYIVNELAKDSSPLVINAAVFRIASDENKKGPDSR